MAMSTSLRTNDTAKRCFPKGKELKVGKKGSMREK
jgi:hypothetical protein